MTKRDPELTEIADLLWLHAHGAPPLAEDPVAALLGLTPWDTAEHMAPNPDWSTEGQLKWYAASSLVLLLNVSEMCRSKAAAAGDRAVSESKVLADGTGWGAG